MTNTIPQRTEVPENLQTRNYDAIPIPRSKKNYFLKSFIPSSIKMWNDTAFDIRRALSLQSLKSKLSDLYSSSSYHLFLAEDGKGAVNHSRIRMGLSGLNGQRKKYNFIKEGNCSSCNYKHEDPSHYFISCPTYAAHRRQLMHDLVQDLPDMFEKLVTNIEKDKVKKEFIEI